MSWEETIINQLCNDIHDDENIHLRDLWSCGAKIVGQLRTAVSVLQESLSSLEAAVQSEEIFSDICALARRHLSSSTQSAGFCWRRLYTDACILGALASALRADRVSDSPVSKSIALSSIAKLDHAIIIAGAPGEGRLDTIFDIISRVQSQHLLSLQCKYSPVRPAMSLGSVYQPRSYSACIPCIDPPSFMSFRDRWSQKPFVLRSYIQDWPAMQEHPWSSFDYLRSVAGPGRLIPVEVGDDYRADDWTQRLMAWDEFLQSLQSPRGPHNRHNNDVLYLAQHNLMMQFPALRKDISIPDYVFASMTSPSDFPNYRPPENEDQLVINVWLGPGGTISPAHTDPFFNCYAQVVGRKTIWLAPPDTTPFMYPYPASLPLADGQTVNPAANNVSPSMSNTSRVDVFPPSAQAEEASREAFAAFWSHVPDKAQCLILEPGDLLFFPPGWWHAMRGEETSFSVSMWF